MTQIINIEGMTCNGCRTGVEKKLNAMAGIKNASVDLEKKSAILETEKAISIKEIRQALPEKYIIREADKVVSIPTKTKELTTQESSELKQLFPLFLILGYITTASFLMNRNPWDGDAFMLDFMGLFYIVFSFFKLLDLKGFPESFRMYDPLAKIFPLYAWGYPFIETALGVMFLMRFQIPIALIATILILGITTIGVTKTLVDKKAIQCACLGTALKLPMTKATFIENAIMLVMAVWMLISIN